MLAMVLSKLAIPSGGRGMPAATAHSGATAQTDAAFVAREVKEN